MLKSVQGIYREGRIELLEPPPQGVEGPVIVTFLAEAESVDLAARGIDRRQASDLRRRLASFAEDWERPEMDVYDAP
jgi:alkanesulfonate monooxygenase SsuD/methylene tetrahydromethanopterin reductase-like flavin-dependent oxidoreductase (luciferase family)